MQFMEFTSTLTWPEYWGDGGVGCRGRVKVDGDDVESFSLKDPQSQFVLQSQSQAWYSSPQSHILESAYWKHCNQSYCSTAAGPNIRDSCPETWSTCPCSPKCPDHSCFIAPRNVKIHGSLMWTFSLKLKCGLLHKTVLAKLCIWLWIHWLSSHHIVLTMPLTLRWLTIN